MIAIKTCGRFDVNGAKVKSENALFFEQKGDLFLNS